MQVPQMIEALINDDEAPYSLIIIDSIMNLFRIDYVGRGLLQPRQSSLVSIFRF